MTKVIPKDLEEELDKFPPEMREEIINLYKTEEAQIKKEKMEEEDKKKIAELYKSLGAEPKKE